MLINETLQAMHLEMNELRDLSETNAKTAEILSSSEALMRNQIKALQDDNRQMQT